MKIDYEKLSELAGHSNVRSTSNAMSRIWKKLKLDSENNPKASASPQKQAPKRKKDDSTHDDGKNVKSNVAETSKGGNTNKRTSNIDGDAKPVGKKIKLEEDETENEKRAPARIPKARKNVAKATATSRESNTNAVE